MNNNIQPAPALKAPAPSSPAAGSPAGVFTNSIATMNSGAVAADIDDALRNCVRAALECAKPARVTITLDIIPAGSGVGDTPLFRVDDDIKIKLPKKKRDKATLFFADDDCNLTRRNPRQEEIRLEAVEGGARLTREDLRATGTSAQ
jgi:hypothetical protein